MNAASDSNILKDLKAVVLPKTPWSCPPGSSSPGERAGDPPAVLITTEVAGPQPQSL